MRAAVVVHDVFSELKRCKARLLLREGKLRLEAPKGALDSSLREKIARHKDAIVAYLSSQEAQRTQSAWGSDAIGPRPSQEPRVLSYAQEQLWILSRYHSGDATYNMPSAYRFEGPFDTDRFVTAIMRTVERHEVLRTTMMEEGGSATLVVHPSTAVMVRRVDLSHLPSFSQEDELEALAEEDAQGCFDLAKHPPFRATLVQLSDQEHGILLNVHHVAADARSMELLRKEIFTSYDALEGDPSYAPSTPPLQYSDYAHWQRGRLAAGALEHQLAYWQRQLRGVAAVHGVPLDGRRGAKQQGSGGTLLQRLSPELSSHVMEHCRGRDYTPFMLLQAAFSVVIAGRSQRTDVVMGTTISGRSHADLESMVGLLINVLVLRTEVDPALEIEEFIQRNREMILSAYEHQQVPFSSVVAALNPPRMRDVSPLFQLMISWPDQQHAKAARKADATAIHPLRRKKFTPKNELEIVVHGVVDEQLTLRWDYRADLFALETVESLIEDLELVLRGMVAGGRRTIGALIPQFRPGALPLVEEDRTCSGQRERWGGADFVRRYRDGSLLLISDDGAQGGSRAHRVSLGEVEERLKSLTRLEDAAVFHDPDLHRLVAYVVGSVADADELNRLRETIVHEMPSFMVPGIVVPMANLPRGEDGQVALTKLPKADAVFGDFAAVEGATERTVAQVWCEVLELVEVGAHDDFFALGGSSLLGILVVNGLTERLGREVSIRTLFEHSTVRSLAAALDEHGPHGAADAGVGAPVGALADSQPRGDIQRVARDGRLPLSLAQQRLWFIDQLAGRSAEYNIAFSLGYEGVLDGAILGTALSALIARHEVLRTTYETHDGEACQRIHDDAALEVTEVDLASLEEGEQAAVSRQIYAEERDRPFDLASEYPIRATLLQLGGQRSAVVLNIHHIAADGWSIGVVMRELAELYEAISDGRSPSLMPLPVQYVDYAAWQRERVRSESSVAALAYWKRQLEGVPLVHSLPLDRPRPKEATFEGQALHTHLSRESVDRLCALAHEERATPFMVLQALFAALLGYWTSERDIVVGTPSAGRNHANLEGLIGCFVNMLVLRTTLDETESLRGLIRRCRDSLLEGFDHQELPFDTLVDALAVPRTLSHAPVFQITFSMGESPVDGEGPQGARWRRGGSGSAKVAGASQSTKYDLEVEIAPSADGMRCTWLYNVALFDAQSIEAAARAFSQLVAQAIAAPSAPVMGHALAQAPHERSSPAGATGKPRLVWPQLFERTANARPDAVALRLGARSFTYAELQGRVRALASACRARGVRPGDRVVLCLERGVEMVVAILATLRVGAAYVPVNPNHPTERVRFIINDADARLILTHRPALEGVETDSRLTTLEDLAGTSESARGDDHEAPVANLWPESSTAYVIYTSGTTGQPKGVAISHGAVANYAYSVEEVLGKHPGPMAVASPFTFDASVEGLLQMSMGRELIVLDDQCLRDPHELRTVLRRRRPALLESTPSLVEVWLANGLGEEFPNLILGGEAISPTLWRRLVGHGDGRQTASYNTYGPTETTISVTYGVLAGETPHIGHPLKGYECHVCSPGLQRLPQGFVGEFCVGGAGVGVGYAGRGGLTADRFMPDPYSGRSGARVYRTGDLARFRADGSIEFIGRADSQVKVHGQRIELGEIEAALQQLPTIDACSVVVEGAGVRARIVAHCVLAERGVKSAPYLLAPSQALELRRTLGEQLPQHMLPTAFVALDALPITAHGKLDRQSLPTVARLDLEHRRDRVVETLSGVERTLQGVWQEVVGSSAPPALDDNFFLSGGDSILAVQLVARARQRGLHVTVRQIFETQTLRGLARAAREHNDLLPSAVLTGEQLLLPVQRQFFEWPLHHPHHYNISMLLQTPPDLSEADARHLITSLTERHQALSLRFERSHEGWRGVYLRTDGKDEGHLDLKALDFSDHDDDEFADAVTQACLHTQSSLDYTTGPVFAAVYCSRGERRGRLLLVFHHLVFDWVSWRIVKEDLETAYREGSGEQGLPATASTFQQWGEALHRYAKSPALQAEQGFWLEELRRYARFRDPNIILSASQAAGTESHAAIRAKTTFDVAWLMQLAAEQVDVTLHDCILAVITRAYQRWRGGIRGAVRLVLQGHGREQVIGPDVSETVGWFTTEYPLIIDPCGGDLGTLLRAVHHENQRVPNAGIGFGVLRDLLRDPAICALDRTQRSQSIGVNYRGKFNLEESPRKEAFSIAPESRGSDVGDESVFPSENLLETVVSIRGQEVHLQSMSATDRMSAGDLWAFVELTKSVAEEMSCTALGHQGFSRVNHETTH